MTLFVQINQTNDTTGKPVFEETPKNYNLYASTETAKYTALHIILAAGATLDAVSGCGSGYYIQITATESQAAEINKKLQEVTK
jgi:hypothetical protein